MISLLVLEGAIFSVSGLSESSGFGAEGFPVELINFVEVAHARAGKTDELPANHIGVTAVEGIAKHSFDGVLTEELKEHGRFDFLQGLVLFCGREKIEASERF